MTSPGAPGTHSGDTVNQDKIRTRAMKVLALARRGERGEKEAAQSMLDRLLEKYGMSMADLDDESESKQWVRLSYRGPFEKRVLVAVACKVLNVSALQVHRRKGAQNFEVELTRVQALEIELQWAIYRRELKKTLANSVAAFVHANSIYSNALPDANKQASPLSPEDVAAILAMAKGMKSVPIHKAIAA